MFINLAFQFFRMTNYDYIILGAGASGLMLAYRMASDTFFDDKSILIIDKEKQKGNDRTWCFWENGEGEWDDILTKTWSKIYFGSDNYISRYEFAIELAGIFRLDDSLIVPTTTEILTRDVASYNAIRPKHSGLDTNKIEKELNINTYSTSYSLREMNNILN